MWTGWEYLFLSRCPDRSGPSLVVLSAFSHTEVRFSKEPRFSVLPSVRSPTKSSSSSNDNNNPSAGGKRLNYLQPPSCFSAAGYRGKLLWNRPSILICFITTAGWPFVCAIVWPRPMRGWKAIALREVLRSLRSDRVTNNSRIDVLDCWLKCWQATPLFSHLW